MADIDKWPAPAGTNSLDCFENKKALAVAPGTEPIGGI